jgi:hypothetical protein
MRPHDLLIPFLRVFLLLHWVFVFLRNGCRRSPKRVNHVNYLQYVVNGTAYDAPCAGPDVSNHVAFTFHTGSNDHVPAHLRAKIGPAGTGHHTKTVTARQAGFPTGIDICDTLCRRHHFDPDEHICTDPRGPWDRWTVA